MAEAKKKTKAAVPAAKKKKAASPARRRPAREAPDGKKLVIVESPAKAKTIGKYLGSDFVVKASMGHVRDLPAKELGVDIEKDFEPTYEPLRGRKKVITELRKYVRSAPEVYLATDLDREGEAIAWHLAEALQVDDDRLRRVVFNEITRTAIVEAFDHAGKIDQHKVDAQQARRILDRIVGYQLSPLLWKKVARGLSAGRVQTVAVRLIVDREREIKAFIPDEFWRVTGIFSPDPFAGAGLEDAWRQFVATLDEKGAPPTQAAQFAWLAEHGVFRGELVKWKGERFDCNNSDDALELLAALGVTVSNVEQTDDPKGKGPAKNRVALATIVHPDGSDGAGVGYRVLAVQTRVSRNRASAPFTTASMQQAASVRLRFSASRTMRQAQSLYEGVDVPGEGSVGLITYMRTDSVNIASQAIDQVRGFIAKHFGDDYVPEKPNVFRSGPRAQAAHEAIRPTDVTRTPESLKGALSSEQWKLYDLIWRRFVACQMAPARWLVTDVDVAADTSAGQAVFRASGRRLEFDGQLRVAGMPRHDEQLLPELTEGKPVGPVAIDADQRFTQPPPRYTEASLVKSLEAEGIGRPSTYAAIIQTIQDREYVKQEERRFYATELGMVVTDKLLEYFSDLFDLRFTARMEDLLDEVESGKADWVKVLRDFYEPFKKTLEIAGEKMVHAKAETEPSEYTCPNCDKPMVYRWSKNGKYLACTGYPDCKTTFPVDDEGKKIEPKEVDVICPECGKKMLCRRGRFGVFLGCTGYPECRGTLPCTEDGTLLKLVKEEDIKESCPECGSAMVVRRRGRGAFLACSRYPECKTTQPLPEGIRIAAPPKAAAETTGVTCPKCGKKELVIRDGRRGKFIACSGYPRCRNTYDVAHLDDLKAGKDPHKEKEKDAEKE